MSTERRNHYRILFVQPEAPPEVIKAAYRALMSTLRVHPDLGGDSARAARLNAAYAVLSDPEARRAYDLSLKRSPRARPAAEAPAAEAAASPACPFCRLAMPQPLPPQARCLRCDSPLTPAPRPERHAGAELLGRRHGERIARDMAARVWLPGVEAALPARLRDLSLGGLSLCLDRRLAPGTVFRVSAEPFDALAAVAGSRSSPAGLTVHARLLTLQITRGPRGVYLDAKV